MKRKLFIIAAILLASLTQAQEVTVSDRHEPSDFTHCGGADGTTGSFTRASMLISVPLSLPSLARTHGTKAQVFSRTSR